MPKTLKHAAFLAAAISMVVLPALAQRTTFRPAWNLFSTQQDIEMGRILADDAERNFQLVGNNNANAYIDALGKQLAAHVTQGRYPYQFKIVNDGAVNAWALPGGFIYVTSGLIQAAQNEPELAGVVAHQIAHVVLRHGTAEVSQAYANQVPNSRARLSVNEAMSRLNIRFEPSSIPLKFTREEEREADVLATQIMYDTGFDPQVISGVFQAISSDRSNRARDFLDAHPYLSNGAAIVRTEIRNLGSARASRGDSPDFHSVKDRLLAANTNDNNWPRSTRTASTRMALFSGRDIEFRYPDNWRASDDGDAISVAPDNGFVSGLLAYGMTIATFEPQGTRYFGRNSFATPGARRDNVTLANATDQLVAHLRESNPNLRVVRNTERSRVDGEQAMVVELANASPAGGNETDWLVAVLRPNGTMRYFVGVAPQSEFNRYQRMFEQIVASVRFLH